MEAEVKDRRPVMQLGWRRSLRSRAEGRSGTEANSQDQRQVGTPRLGCRRLWSGTEQIGNRTSGAEESAGESCRKIEDNLAERKCGLVVYILIGEWRRA